MGFIPRPRVAMVVNPSGRLCSGWRDHRKSIMLSWLSISCVCFFQAKPGEGLSGSISIMAWCFIPRVGFRVCRDTCAHTARLCEWEGQDPICLEGSEGSSLPLSSLSLSYQASTLMAAELYFLIMYCAGLCNSQTVFMWHTPKHFFYWILSL